MIGQSVVETPVTLVLGPVRVHQHEGYLDVDESVPNAVTATARLTCYFTGTGPVSRRPRVSKILRGKATSPYGDAPDWDRMETEARMMLDREILRHGLRTVSK